MKLLAPIIELLGNILAGTRAALFMPVHLWSFKGGYLQICLLLVVSLGLSLIYDYYDTAPDNYFNPYGLSYQALLYLSFFFSLSLIAVLNSRQQDLGKLIILLLSIVPVVWLGSVCLLALAKQQTYLDAYQSHWAVFIVYSLWYLLVVARLLKRFFYLTVLPTIVYVVLYAIFNFSPLFLLPTEPLWYPLQSSFSSEKQKNRIDVETIYYSQNTLLDETVNDLVQGKDGVADLFFIGFAGDADEDVFMNEVKAARAIIDNLFNAFGRSMLLINNEATVDSVPLANGHNLKNSIRETANLMNTDEDILLLFLTSHGSEDHYISANFPPFKLNNIDAQTINTALNLSGIKWRIIIISACYSGGFIEPLANPHTLLITAASAERNSFGCGHDGKYTYFGDAYLESALKQTKSFINAFDIAREIISEKENKEGFKNSNPQIKIGAEIEKKLIEYEKKLETKRSNNWATTVSG
jgi:peptidase C13-like protein